MALNRFTPAESDRRVRGTWRVYENASGKPKVYIICPHCGNRLELNDAHVIWADGSVHESVLCSVPDCGYHEFITLEGWTP